MKHVAQSTHTASATKGGPAWVKARVAHGVRILVKQQELVCRVFNHRVFDPRMLAACLAVHVTGHAHVHPQRQTDVTGARTAVDPINFPIPGVRPPSSADNVLTSHMGENRSRLGMEGNIGIKPGPVPVSLQNRITRAAPDPVLLPVPVGRTSKRQVPIIVILVHVDAKGDLPHVVEAFNRASTFLGAGQGRQQQGGQNRDDGDHDQQFDQRESPFFLIMENRFHFIARRKLTLFPTKCQRFFHPNNSGF